MDRRSSRGNGKKNSISGGSGKEGRSEERSAAGESPLVAVDTCPLGEGREKEERDGWSSVWLAKRYNSCEALHCTPEGSRGREREKRLHLQHGTVVSRLYQVQFEHMA